MNFLRIKPLGVGAIIGCLILYLRLPFDAKMLLPVRGGIGLLLYFAYGSRHGLMGAAVIEVHETDPIEPRVPGLTDVPSQSHRRPAAHRFDGKVVMIHSVSSSIVDELSTFSARKLRPPIPIFAMDRCIASIRSEA